MWSRIGRPPVIASGNSNGDIPMLHYTGGPAGQRLRLLLLDDDPERKLDYTACAENSLEDDSQDLLVVVSELGWTVHGVTVPDIGAACGVRSGWPPRPETCRLRKESSRDARSSPMAR